MARKSNKTAHVLNLLSGHDTKKEPEKELETDVKKDADPISEQDSQPKGAQQPHPDPEPTEKIPRGKISVPDSPSVSIIDQTEKDPVAEQIQANLFQEFQKEHDMNPEESQKESREKSRKQNCRHRNPNRALNRKRQPKLKQTRQSNRN